MRICSKENLVKELGRDGIRKGAARFRGRSRCRGHAETWVESTLRTLWALIVLLEADTGRTTPGT